MGSYHFSAPSFDPEALSALYASFDAAWELVESETDAADCDAVRERMALTIVALAKSGETDTGRLTAWAVARGRHSLATAPSRLSTVVPMSAWEDRRAASHRRRQALARAGRRSP